MWPNVIEGLIDADEVILGEGIHIEEGVRISGKGGRARRVEIGDFCYIGRETRILAPEFTLGDYTKLNAFSFGHGEEPLRIGRNCWIGGNVVLDSMGGLTLDDNVGIGAHSQIWTHIQFGDIVEGCRFNSRQPMHIGRDAWFVGHCIVSPVKVEEKSMALVGSVITKDMLRNRIYAGVPAKDITDKAGPQFVERSLDEKAETLQGLIDAFVAKQPDARGKLRVVTSSAEMSSEGTTFNVSDRTYTKTKSEAEVGFLKRHVPLIKFVPAS